MSNDIFEKLDTLNTHQKIKAESLIATMLDIEPRVENSNVPNIKFIAKKHNMLILIDMFEFIMWYQKRGEPLNDIVDKIIRKITYITDKASRYNPKVVGVLNNKLPLSLKDYNLNKLFKPLIDKGVCFVYDAYGNTSVNILKTLADEYATIKKRSLIICNSPELACLRDSLTGVIDFNFQNMESKKKIKSFNPASVINTNTIRGIETYIKILIENKCFEIII